MPSRRKIPQTVGAAAFEPDKFFDEWNLEKAPQSNRLKDAITTAFHLKSNDDYVYHATASVTLGQVQAAINAGNSHGLHAWYLFEDARQVGRLHTFRTCDLSESRKKHPFLRT